MTPSLMHAITRWFVCACWLIAAAAGAQAPAESSPAPAAQNSPPQQVGVAAVRTNPVTVAAAQQGVLTCSSRINQVVNYLGVDDKAGALLMVAPTQQDQRFVSLSMELPSPTTNTSTHVSANFAPNQANGCGASYDAVTYWPKTCDELGSQNFAAFKSLGRIKKDVRVLDGGATLKVFLLPAGSGCVSIRKEVVL